MTEFVFTYECRKCKEIVEGEEIGNEMMAVVSLIDAMSAAPISLSGSIRVKQYTLHRCKDSGYGIADLQGYSKKRGEGTMTSPLYIDGVFVGYIVGINNDGTYQVNTDAAAHRVLLTERPDLLEKFPKEQQEQIQEIIK